MHSVGFHQARRPRRRRRARFAAALAWPNPAGIAVSAAGAALVFAGALGVHGGFPVQGTTPAPTQADPGTSGVAGFAREASTESGSPSEGSRNDGSAGTPPSGAGTSAAPGTQTLDGGTATAPPAATPGAQGTGARAQRAPLVSGAGPGSPIDRLFSSGAARLPTSMDDIANPASTLVLVNKHHPLAPLTWTPPDLVTVPAATAGSAEPVQLRTEAAAAVERMFAAAARDGVPISIQSGFRSHDTQVGLYGGYVAQKGQAAADTSSARPGYSEHQTGLALDIGDPTAPASCEFTVCMAGTAAARWVAAHGADYGFIVRFPDGAQRMTGYLYEPWHLRYVGVPVARDMRVRGIVSYEQYVGLPGAPDY